jgi:excisionase family DNA binding protein
LGTLLPVFRPEPEILHIFYTPPAGIKRDPTPFPEPDPQEEPGMSDQNTIRTVTPIMNVRELATYLRLSEAKVYRMANSGSVPAFRVGKSWRFKKDMIDDWIQRQIKTSAV